MTDRNSAGTTNSTTTGSQYVVQNLPDRYIRSRVLDDYINARLDEFGHYWTRTVYQPWMLRERGRVTIRARFALLGMKLMGF
jgi:hypothetical protein